MLRKRLIVPFGLLFAVIWPGCHPTPQAQPSPQQGVAIAATNPGTPSTTPSKPQQRDHFDGKSAFACLQKQCDFGARPIGSEAHEKCLAYLLSEMRKYADETITQKWDYKAGSNRLANTNVVGVFYPAGSNKPSAHPVLLMAHWDTRPIADGPFSDETRRGVTFRFTNGTWKPTAPIVGADDAASGVAVLLELAKMFKKNRPASGVILLLDDGEDYGDFQGTDGSGDGVELGAKYFAAHYKETPQFGQPTFGILLDMVGAKNAFFPREAYSEEKAKLYNDRVYAAAQALGFEKVFPSDKTQSVGDDHVSVNEAGIPTIDLIHPLPFSPYLETGYTYWHTTHDTADKCSAETLRIVGEVVASVVYAEAP